MLKDYDNNSKKNKRVRKILYFIHPFDNSVKTNKGKQFFDLVRLNFLKNYLILPV